MNGLRHGKGVFNAVFDGEMQTRYEGMWANDIRQGQGVLTYLTGITRKKGTKIEGSWDQGRCNGKA